MPGILRTRQDILPVKGIQINHVKTAFVERIRRDGRNFLEQGGIGVWRKKTETLLQLVYGNACRVGDYRGLSELLLDLDAQLEPGDVVVADDPRWGTPLLLAHGRDVLDGKRLWESAEPGFQADYLRMLRRLQREEGRRVLWLTSTEAGLGVYPLDIGPVAPVFEDLPFSYRTVVHSARADHFEARDNPRVFGLYEWQAAHAAAPVPTPVE